MSIQRKMARCWKISNGRENSLGDKLWLANTLECSVGRKEGGCKSRECVGSRDEMRHLWTRMVAMEMQRHEYDQESFINYVCFH